MSESRFHDSEGYEGSRYLSIAEPDDPHTHVFVGLREGLDHVDLRVSARSTYFGRRIDPELWLALCRASLRHLGTHEERARYQGDET